MAKAKAKKNWRLDLPGVTQEDIDFCEKFPDEGYVWTNEDAYRDGKRWAKIIGTLSPDFPDYLRIGKLRGRDKEEMLDYRQSWLNGYEYEAEKNRAISEVCKAFKVEEEDIKNLFKLAQYFFENYKGLQELCVDNGLED